MSIEKTMKGRVINKHRTEQEWYNSVYRADGSFVDSPFVPLNGELIIYDPDDVNKERRFKFGDGVRYVTDLPFAVNTTTGSGDNSLQFAGAGEASGEGSIAMGDQSSSVTDYSVAIGKEVTAGCKAYYFSAIDLVNKQIYLSETKEQTPVIVEGGSSYYNSNFETPAYTVREVLTESIYVDPYGDGSGGTTVDAEFGKALVNGKVKATTVVENEDMGNTLYSLTFVSTVYDAASNEYIVEYKDADGNVDFCHVSSDYTFLFATSSKIFELIIPGDEICIINGEYHPAFCGQITAVDHNKITYEGDLGFTEISTTGTRPFEHDHVFYTPTNPSIGVIDDLFVGSFAAGRYNVAAGEDAVVAGYGNIVGANHGAAFGKNNRVGNFGFVTGNSNDATGSCAYVEGKDNINKGYMGHIEGRNNKIAKEDADNNRYVHVEGYSNTHNAGKNNHVEGVLQKVEGGECLHIEGRQNTSKAGIANHIEGTLNNVIKGNYNHIEGRSNDITSGNDNHIEGYQNTSNGSAQHVAGKFNKANSQMSRITGGGTSDSDRKNIEELDWEGNLILAGGIKTGGTSTLADVHVTGNSVFGTGHTISSPNTQVEGLNNKVTSSTGVNHVEGYMNDVNARYSHIEGVSNTVTNHAYRVHIEGRGNTASGNDQHIAGRYNEANSTLSRITGGGEKGSPKNIEELDWNGNIWFAGSVSVGSTNDRKMLATQEYADNIAITIRSEIERMVFITVEDIDAICGTTIQDATSSASEVTF